MSQVRIIFFVLLVVTSIFTAELSSNLKHYPCATTYRFPYELDWVELTCYFYISPIGTGSDHRIVSYHNKHIKESEDDKVYELVFQIESPFEFPKGLFWKFPQVEMLTVNQPGVEHINPKSFDSADKLNEANFDHNNLKSLKNETFDGAASLHKLKLSNNKIANIEAGAFNGLENLEELNLSGNQLEIFHVDTFKILTNLKNLDLSKNHIESLQDDLFINNNDLESLLLFDNKVSVISRDLFSNLKSLTTLDLRFNICVDAKYQNAMNMIEMIKMDLRPCAPPREIPDPDFH